MIERSEFARIVGARVESDLEELADLSDHLRGGEEIREAVNNLGKDG